MKQQNIFKNLPDSDSVWFEKRHLWLDQVVLMEFPQRVLSLSKLDHGLRVAFTVLSLCHSQPFTELVSLSTGVFLPPVSPFPCPSAAA